MIVATVCTYVTLLVLPGHPSQWKTVRSIAPILKPVHLNGRIWQIAVPSIPESKPCRLLTNQ